jgi:hypothetical protein
MSRFRIAVLATTAIAVALLGGNCQGPVDPAAERQFRARLGEMSITVFPSIVRSERLDYDVASQMELIAHFTKARLAKAYASGVEITVPSEPSYDQSRMWRASAEAFAAHIRNTRPDSDYALLAEFLMNGRGEPIGIHAYVADAAGRLSYGVGLNSHHAVFSRNNPKTLADAIRVLLEYLEEDLKLATPEQAREAPEPA